MNNTGSDIGAENVKLLASANDTGAAKQLIQVLSLAKSRYNISISVVTSRETAVIFEGGGFDLILWNIPRTQQSDLRATRENLDEAERLIKLLKPSVILVGLSGPDSGLDEALVACASGTPTYAIQDFWGDVNTGFGSLPNTYFVLDKAAANITKLRAPGSRIIISSSTREATRQGLHSTHNQPHQIDNTEKNLPVKKIFFFGQPLWHLAGYHQTLDKIAGELSDLFPDARFFYRPHPKENKKEFNQVVKFFDSTSLSVEFDYNKAVETSLSLADLSLTCFSLCSLDLIHLSANAANPLGVMVHTMFEPDIKIYYQNTTRLKLDPLFEQDLVCRISEPSEIKAVLNEATQEPIRRDKWIAAAKAAELFSNASQIIVQTIVTDLNVEKKHKRVGKRKMQPQIFKDNYDELIFSNDIVMEALANQIYAKNASKTSLPTTICQNFRFREFLKRYRERFDGNNLDDISDQLKLETQYPRLETPDKNKISFDGPEFVILDGQEIFRENWCAQLSQNLDALGQKDSVFIPWFFNSSNLDVSISFQKSDISPNEHRQSFFTIISKRSIELALEKKSFNKLIFHNVNLPNTINEREGNALNLWTEDKANGTRELFNGLCFRFPLGVLEIRKSKND